MRIIRPLTYHPPDLEGETSYIQEAVLSLLKNVSERLCHFFHFVY